MRLRIRHLLLRIGNGRNAVEQWDPRRAIDFEDLGEAPRWHQPPVVFAAACWGAVITAAGLVLAVILGRQIPLEAWAIPAGLGALAAYIRSPREGNQVGAQTREGPQIESGARPKELPGAREAARELGDGKPSRDDSNRAVDAGTLGQRSRARRARRH